MPLHRFRLRTLMLTVAIMAVVIAGVQMRARSKAYRQRAESSATSEQYWRDGEYNWSRTARRRDDQARTLPAGLQQEQLRQAAKDCRALAQKNARLASYHAALLQKYERAASYPWLTVEPDPPRP
jgi:type II secretory pathway component PulK